MGGGGEGKFGDGKFGDGKFGDGTPTSLTTAWTIASLRLL